MDLHGYRVYRTTHEGVDDSAWVYEVPGTETVFRDSLVNIWQRYYYRISAVDSSLNESPLSDEVSATPFAKEWYVDARSVAGDGSQASPFRYIQEALNAAHYKDRAYVAPGTYAENIVLAGGVELIGAGAEVCEIIGKEPRKPVVMGASEASIRGFTIRQTVSNWATIGVSGTSITVSDNIILSTGTSPYRSGDAVECFGTCGSVTISRNIISHAPTAIFWRGDLSLPLAKISNNIIYDVREGIILKYTNGDISNNTIYIGEARPEEADPALRVHNSTFLRLYNNIFVVRHGYSAVLIPRMYDFNPVLDASCNDVWGGFIVLEGCVEGCESREDDLSVDPLFVNVDKGDFRLKPNSPCRDAGNRDSAWDDTDGTRNDMGAHGGPDPIRIRTYHPKVAVIVPPVSGVAGDTLMVQVQLDNAAGLAEAVIALSYDPQLLTPLRAETTELTPGFSLAFAAVSGGTANITLSSETEIEGGQGAIAKIAFVVPPSASKNRACPLELREIGLRDGAGALIEIKSLADGAFVVIDRGPTEHFIYVDQRYPGVEDGSWSKPFNTIGEAMAAASVGDTIQVAAGIYRERTAVKEGVFLKGSGPLASKIWIENDSLDMAAVVFHNVSSGGISGFDIRRNGRFEGPTVECRASSPLITRNRIVSGEGLLGSAIFCQGTTASRAQIEDNFIEVGSQGTGIWCNASNPIIAGNRLLVAIGDLGGVIAAAVFCEASDPLILNNQIRLGEHAIGIQCLNSSHVTIANNYLGGNTRSQWGIRGSASSLRVTNNLLRGFETAILTGSALVENNIIWENDTGIGCDNGVVVQLSYNLFENNGTNYAGCVSVSRDLIAAPLFVDPEGEDFRLQMGSSGIDGGDPDPQCNDPDGSRNDVGIYGGPYAVPGRGVVPAVKLSLPDRTGAPGDTLSLPVEVTNASGVAEAQMVVAYPSESISVLDVRTTGASRAFALTTERVAEGEVRIAMSYPTGLTEGTGSLVDLTLVVNAAAAVGSESKITIKEMALRDELAGVVIASARKAGTIRIAPPTVVESGERAVVPLDFSLFQNNPNPFNVSTVISFTLPERQVTGDRSEGIVRLVIYNLVGQEVRTLVDKTLGGGQHRVVWDGRDNLGRETSSGVYVYRLAGGRRVGTRRMVLLR